MTDRTGYKTVAAICMAFFLLIVAGNLWLASAFDFPDILREPAEVRFDAFRSNQGSIVSAYYVMGVTSILQIFIAVGMYHLTKRGSLAELFALAAGVLSGLFQVLGFFRWVVLIPMLAAANESGEISSEIVFFLEKFANAYMGMTVGEHLGTLFTGLWLLTLGITLLKNPAFDRKLSWLGLAAGIALIAQSFEAVAASSLAFLADISIALWAIYVIWIFILSIQLFFKKDALSAQPVRGFVWLLGLLIYAANVIPAML